ncbi:MAG: shikimate kinase [Candidatus Eiseniibacteriota bacterium]
METRPYRPIALIGLMGAGKSEVARMLARRLDAPALDLDALIEADSGASIEQWFERHGEAAFRQREREMLNQALERAPGVIACGGGIVLDQQARALLANHCRTVWLEVSPAEAARRLAGVERSRPLLGEGEPSARLTQLLGERDALYRGAAQVRVPTDGRSASQVADAVLEALASAGHA